MPTTIPDGYLSVSCFARAHGIRPSRVSRFLYDYCGPSGVFPLERGRRLIPVDRVDLLLMELRRAGITADTHAPRLS